MAQRASTPPGPFLEEIRQVVRRNKLGQTTEKAYVYYVKDFILCQGKRHPKDLGAVARR